MKRKPGTSVKKNPYISMDGLYGMKDEFLDAALLSHFSDSDIAALVYNNSTPTLLRSINVSKHELNKMEGSLLREKVSGILNSNYELYNKFVNRYLIFMDSTLSILGGKTNRTNDEIVQNIHEFYDKNLVPTHTTINILRLYKNGLHKQLLVTIIASQNLDSIYKELISKQASIISIQDNELDKETKENNQEIEGELIEEIEQNDEISTESAPSGIIKNAIQMLERASALIHENEEEGKYKDLYESLVEEHNTLQEKLNDQGNSIKDLEKTIKSNAKQINGFTVEVNQLKSANNKLSQSSDSQLKEQGKIAQALGEARRERDTLQAEKDALSRKLLHYDKENSRVMNEKSFELRQELNKEIKKYQTDLEKAHQESDNLKSKLEIQSNNLVELQLELEEKTTELEKLNKENQLLISEREELQERKAQVNESSQTEDESNLDFGWFAKEFNYDNVPT